jgi:perosamine synthetase
VNAKPALEGGTPQRSTFLPYGRQVIEDDDVAAVAAQLRSDFLTTGPTVERFEAAFARAVGAKHAVAVANGTVALHLMARAAGLGVGERMVTTHMTFVATANAALYCGATPVFADVDPETGLLDLAAARAAADPATKALSTVDFAGLPLDTRACRDLASHQGVPWLSDAAHALGAEDHGRRVGSQADMTMFSLHPVKHITTGEGGVVTTDREDLATRLRLLRNHGMDRDVAKRLGPSKAYYYEIVDLGYNYRITDIQCALGLSQLAKLDRFLAAREHIAARYTRQLQGVTGVRTPSVPPNRRHAWHLYVIRLDLARLKVGRDRIFEALRAENIGVHVHYTPVHLMPLYRERLGTRPGQLPKVERFYEEILTLPIHPGMSDADVDDVVEAVRKVNTWYAR